MNLAPRTLQTPAEFARALQEVRKVAPKVFVEIGSFAGGSLAGYAQACAPGATIIAVDRGGLEVTPLLEAAVARLRERGFDAWWVKGMSCDAGTVGQVWRLLDGRPIEFLHVDGDYATESVLADWRTYWPMLAGGGLAAFHDIIWVDGRGQRPVAPAWEQIKRGWPSMDITDGLSGIGLVWKRKPERAEA